MPQRVEYYSAEVFHQRVRRFVYPDVDVAAITGVALRANRVEADDEFALARDSSYADNVGDGATSFTVTVTQQAVSNLTARFVSNAGVVNSLQQKLRQATDAAARGDLKGKAHHVDVYIHELQNHIGKFVSAQNAAILIRMAQAF